MGNINSGNHRLDKKRLIENCIAFDVRKFIDVSFADLQPFERTFSINHGRGKIVGKMKVEYLTNQSRLNDYDNIIYIPSHWQLVLDYNFENINARGGLFYAELSNNTGYVLKCPQCKQWHRIYYIPISAGGGDTDGFLCRACHNLTYKSSQSAIRTPQWYIDEVKQLIIQKQHTEQQA